MAIAAGERDALEHLGEDEARLERALADARAVADACVAAARRDAERVEEVARREAEREAERIRAAAAEEVDRLAADAEADLRTIGEQLRDRAARNWERAVARAVAAVTGAGERP